MTANKIQREKSKDREKMSVIYPGGGKKKEEKSCNERLSKGRILHTTHIWGTNFSSLMR